MVDVEEDQDNRSLSFIQVLKNPPNNGFENLLFWPPKISIPLLFNIYHQFQYISLLSPCSGIFVSKNFEGLFAGDAGANYQGFIASLTVCSLFHDEVGLIQQPFWGSIADWSLLFALRLITFRSKSFVKIAHDPSPSRDLQYPPTAAGKVVYFT